MMNTVRQWSGRLKELLCRGRNRQYTCLGLVLLGTAVVYAIPDSIPGFLLFVFGASSIYWLKPNRSFQLALAVVIAFFLVPILGARNIFYLEVVFQISVFSVLALGLNIVVGFSGILHLGYLAFYAVGAYLWGFFGSQQPYLLHSTVTTRAINTPYFLAPNWFYLFIFLGIGLAAVVGLILGLPVLRVRGDYLAIITLAFGEIVRQLANNLDKPWNFTNGPQGISPVQRPTMPEGALNLFNTVFRWAVGHDITANEAYNILFYLIALVVVAVVVVVTYRLDNSKVGRAWTAIREDELCAVAMGINSNKLKLGAFAAGASFAGAMGVLFAASRTFVSPEPFTMLQMISVLIMVILGGIGSMVGVIVGATVITLLNIQVLQSLSLFLTDLRTNDAVIPLIHYHFKNLSTQLDPTKYQRLIFGVALVIMMIFRPSGLVPAARRRRELRNGAAGEEP
jgi:branched-chain amino acid transport system permease protein